MIMTYFNAGIICEDAATKTSTQQVKDLEEAVVRTNEHIKQAEKLKERYRQVKESLQQYANELSRWSEELKQLKKKYQQLVQNSVLSEQISELIHQMEACNAELAKIRKEEALCKERLPEINNSIAHCMKQLVTAKDDMSRLTTTLESSKKAVQHEYQVKIHRLDDQIATAWKWGLGGVVTTVAGGAAALLSGNLLNML